MQKDQSLSGNYVLFLPKWYPSRMDPQLGVFTQKHAFAVGLYRKVIVLYVTTDPSLTKNRETVKYDKGNVIEYIVYNKKSNSIISRPLNFYRYFRAISHQHREIIQNHGIPVVIHSHVLLRSLLFALYYAAKFRLPIVHTEHWTGFMYDAYRKKPAYYRFLCRKAAARANALLIVSEGLMLSMKKQGVINTNTLIIPNVIETFNPIDSMANRSEKIKILTVADLVEKNKNISGTLQALAKIKITHPEMEFHIIGGGEDEAILHQQARLTDPSAEWIFFYGRRDNEFVLKMINNIDFLVTNSNIETFSVITAEAIASGKPVIATRSGGPEFFVNPGNGILISPGNQNELEAAIHKMIKTYKDYNPGVISTEILSKFGQEAVGKQLVEIYDSLT